MDIKAYIRDIPDFPKPGILFKDISPLLRDAAATREVVSKLAQASRNRGATKVLGIESRGFLLGVLLAQELGLGFTPIRKPGKLPGKVIRQAYDLEYGTDAIEIQENALAQGEKVIVHDDVLATGGTASAVCKLVENCGAEVVHCNFLMELGFLNGREKLKPYDLISLIQY